MAVVRSTTRDHNDMVTKVFEPSATKSSNGRRDDTRPAATSTRTNDGHPERSGGVVRTAAAQEGPVGNHGADKRPAVS
jgi:hypothetical protein